MVVMVHGVLTEVAVSRVELDTVRGKENATILHQLLTEMTVPSLVLIWKQNYAK